jgi:uncharacterized membrane protein
MDPIVSTSSTSSGPEPKRVNSDRAVGWITDAWALFSKAPGPWVLVAVVALLIMIVASAIPLLGSLLAPFVSGIVMGSLMLVARKHQEGTAPEVGDLFTILSHPQLKPLLITTLIYVALSFGVGLVVMLVFGMGGGAMALLGGAVGGESAAAAGLGGMVMLGLLVFLACIIPVVAMYWFAVPLVLFRNVEPWQAMKTSLAGVLANLVPMLVYGVVSLVVFVIAMIPLGLGLLIAMPLFLIAWLISYQEIFP